MVRPVMPLSRIIGQIQGEFSGPCLIFIAGIHGNEPAGVKALYNVFGALENSKATVFGSVYGVAGHLWALERGRRYEKQDLNRIWDQQRIDAIDKGDFIPHTQDEKQQLALYRELRKILKKEKGPVYFFDLHTTSGPTKPFMTVNDSLINRRFTQQYPIPMILGVEEYLDGPLLSYLNQLGYVSFGFEGGQHQDGGAVDNHMAFIYLSMVYAGAISKHHIDFKTYHDRLNDQQQIFEIFHRQAIASSDQFKMNPGFMNFQTVEKGTHLAQLNGRPLHATTNTQLFMPLYQDQGADGFFLIRPVAPFFLKLSTLSRKLKLEQLLKYLPGVKRSKDSANALLVDKRIARFLRRPVLHLLGFRSKEMGETHLLIRHREVHTHKASYKNCHWNRW
ncbi:MAG: aspartoacylase [Cytophagaceae bacterium]|nr:aspartoacylase [Cytophagaceae bacterium]